MSETYKKTLSRNEYLAIFKMCEYFDGSETARFVATGVNDRISKAIREGAVKVLEVDEDKKPVLDEKGEQKYRLESPKSIEIVFTRGELDGMYIGIKETVKKNTVMAGDLALIKDICRSLGMSKRFANYTAEVFKKIEVNREPLDEEIIAEPLD